jgi:hypothetical protein
MVLCGKKLRLATKIVKYTQIKMTLYRRINESIVLVWGREYIGLVIHLVVVAFSDDWYADYRRAYIVKANGNLESLCCYNSHIYIRRLMLDYVKQSP